MPTLFPDANDVFLEPSAPEDTPLSSSGSGTKNHVEHHRDLGDAIEAMQAEMALLTHDHSGTGPRATPKLKQINTHEDVDTDLSATAIHHTLGSGPNQAARGNHTHTATQISGLTMITATSATRPTSPPLGMIIFETDTLQVRVWAQFPGASAPRWTLLPVGSVPVCRLLQGTPQKITPAGSIIEWRVEDEDNFGMFSAASSLTEIVIKEQGLYSVDTSVAWTNNDFWADRAMTCITINGQETTRKHWEFLRGKSYFNPGFAQSVDASCKLRLNANDRLGVKAAHNGNDWVWTYSSTSNKQDTRIDVVYMAP
jgi:hypothetical protein